MGMTKQEDIAIRISGVKKLYRLGQIGGGTLTADLQSWWARIRGKEDPNTRIGTDSHRAGKRFPALDGIDLTVRKGEALGIIGSNGAGKSTLLKLLSQVTAPTEGTITLHGRVASMLEVGTGFSPHMTGRENIYLNGAILGMTKAEIDAKMEDIIEFSEIREFIDTPVKRYSSGMYVKLAFSVAAHLDSEILIMDEVLAVGDLSFQKKCLSKMGDAARLQGRTVLYVSHNMHTIRRLCDRCIVLDKGKIIFDGDVETAIGIYLNNQMEEAAYRSYEEYTRPRWLTAPQIRVLDCEYAGRSTVGFDASEPIRIRMRWNNLHPVRNLCLRIEILSLSETPLGTYVLCDFYSGEQGETGERTLTLDASMLTEGEYRTFYTFFYRDDRGNNVNVESVPGLCIRITGTKENLVWDTRYWGHIRLPQPHIDDPV